VYSSVNEAKGGGHAAYACDVEAFAVIPEAVTSPAPVTLASAIAAIAMRDNLVKFIIIVFPYVRVATTFCILILWHILGATVIMIAQLRYSLITIGEHLFTFCHHTVTQE
jgi:hypothetical protein